MEKKFKLVLICGSHRFESKTRLVLKTVLKHLETYRAELVIYDPGADELDIASTLAAAAGEIKLLHQVRAADAVIFCTPEYNGSYSALIKVIIEALGYPSALAGKTVVLFGVAAGAIGAVKALEHLQSVCLHNGAMVLPPFLSIPMINQHFDHEGNWTNEKIVGQIDKVIKDLFAHLHLKS
jgi:NAD(P)H-dependent FMN reductase